MRPAQFRFYFDRKSTFEILSEIVKKYLKPHISLHQSSILPIAPRLKPLPLFGTGARAGEGYNSKY